MAVEYRDVVKKVKIILEREPRKSRVFVDGKELPVKKIEVEQSMDDLLTAKLHIFPDRVTVLRDEMLVDK